MAALGKALDLGVNFIDTAYGYGDGHAEQLVGTALALHGTQDRPIVATKIPHQTGAVGRETDVGIQGDQIVAVGDLSRAEVALSLNAVGYVVAPGLIDIHSHFDFTLLVDLWTQSQIHQSVTTELVGNCGHGCAPITDDIDLFTGNMYRYQYLIDIDWADMDGYLARLEEAQTAINVATLVPNGNFRLAAVSDVGRSATPDETRHAARLSEAGLDAGAFGFSTGLEYPSATVDGWIHPSNSNSNPQSSPG
jgi:N-acyl-D-aspartate/D-glutamate deacylase